MLVLYQLRINVSQQFHITQARSWKYFCFHITNIGIIKKLVHQQSVILCFDFSFGYSWGKCDVWRAFIPCSSLKNPTELYRFFYIASYPSCLNMGKHSETYSEKQCFFRNTFSYQNFFKMGTNEIWISLGYISYQRKGVQFQKNKQQYIKYATLEAFISMKVDREHRLGSELVCLVKS